MSVVGRLFRRLNDFSVDIKDWELLDQGITALWGPSGAGKSTVVRALLGLDEEAEVSWTFLGEDLAKLAIEDRKLAVVFQEPALFPHMSVQANIWFPVKDKKASVDRFGRLVDRLELNSLLKSSVQRLSGGEKQRVALARALIYQPKMLFLDEPFSALDESARKSARSMVKELCDEYSCPALLITHDKEDVEDLAQKITFIEKGQITEVRRT